MRSACILSHTTLVMLIGGYLTNSAYATSVATEQRADTTVATPSPHDSEAPESSDTSQQQPEGRDLFDMDLEDLGNVEVNTRQSQSNAPSTTLDSQSMDFNEAQTTGELLKQATSVTVRRTSALNLDPRIRGYHSEQILASANGMTQLKTRVDIDSLFSQVDPGIVDRVEVIDGPYTSLYGPGFAFLVADLFATPRYRSGPEMHGSTFYTHGSNGRTIYARQNLSGGGRDWGIYASYGLRAGNDYDTGSDSEFLVPSSFNKWDGFFAFSRDLSDVSRIEFNYLRTEINDTELPGVAYDIANSRNDQFNIRYVIQEEPNEPERFVLQYWLHQTGYYGDASRPSKQRTFYQAFATFPAFDEFPVNTVGNGRMDSTGARSYLTIGDSDWTHWIVGADWRRYSQSYRERNFNPAGELVFDGNVFGIPKSRRDDLGAFFHMDMPWCKHIDLTWGARLDWTTSNIDENDPVVTTFAGDPDDYYYDSGLEEPSETMGMTYATAKVKLPNNFVASAGAAYAMRSPSLTELYIDESFVPLVRLGNSYGAGLSDNVPERNLQFDVGLAYEGKRLSCAVRGFHSTIKDYIALSPGYIDPSAPDFIDGGHDLGRDFTYFDWRTDLGTANENADTNQEGLFYKNVDRATMWGGDFFVDMSINDWFSMGGDLAYVKGTNHAPVAGIWDDDDNLVFEPTVSSEPLPGIYPFHGTVWIRMFEPCEKRWGVELWCRMTRQQERVAFTLSELETPGFAVFGLRGHVQVKENLRVTTAVDNLFDRTYTEHGSLVILNRAGQAVFIKEPGISVFVGTEWRF